LTWRILISDGLAPEGINLLHQAAEVVESDDLSDLGDFDALIVRGKTKVTSTVLKSGAPRLRIVGRAGVGVDNIDLRAAADQDVVVVNAPQSATIAVAELTLGLMLSLARSLTAAHASMIADKWEKSQFVGSELSDKTLGIIGVGRIGTAVAQRASGFGMEVLGYDALLRTKRVENRGATAADLDELLARSHFVTVHVPLTDSTRGMINATTLARMRPDAFLISTARGEVINEKDLLSALQDGLLAGVALDVFSKEPPEDRQLIEYARVISTPHIGAQTREAQVRVARDIASEILAGLKGEDLRWQVN
jgi:D-3-phosphoglycerate dehydrogenase